MTRIAHVTDLHFGSEDPLVTVALADEIRADRPDLVAVSGDLTLGARRSEFAAARAFLDGLGVPTLSVPGNHDLTPYKLFERFTNPYGRWRAAIGPETEPVWQDATTAVFGLNTARRIGWNWDWSRGRVTGARLRRLLRRMAQAPGKQRVVVAHHPLLPPEAAPDTVVAGGAAEALAALAEAGVRLVLAGHLHRGYARLARPGPDSPLVLQGSTATSMRLRGEPNAYHRITLEPGRPPRIEIRAWDGTRFGTATPPA